MRARVLRERDRVRERRERRGGAVDRDEDVLEGRHVFVRVQRAFRGRRAAVASHPSSGDVRAVKDQPPADLELVISGIHALREGLSERQRLELPSRFKMFVAQTQTAGYQIGDHPVLENEFAIALEMAKVRQLDRIADLLERVAAQLDERGRRS